MSVGFKIGTGLANDFALKIKTLTEIVQLHMMRRSSTLLQVWILLLLTTALCAQSGPNQGQINDSSENPAGSEIKANITGKVIDAQTNKVLDYATVTLYSVKDSAMVTGVITDGDGAFEIETQTGEYYAKIEFISYQARFIDNIVLEKGKTKVDLGTIELNPDAAVLAEVEVRAEKSEMQMTLDKRVFNVGKDLANQGGTAAELLDNVPSVAVDVEGNVSLRGNQNVRILINGKPSGLIGVGDNNGLRQIPTNLIEKIEVITNPSARYEAEGMTGIINIVLRKDKKSGLNGSFDITAGHPANYGAAINMNYRKDKINFFGSYGLSYRISPGGGSLYQEFYKNDTTFILDQNRDRERGGLSNSFRFGSDYFINSKNTLTASLTYRVSDEDNFSEIIYKDYLNDYPTNFLGSTIRTDNEKENEYALEYAINYKKTFDKKDQVFTFDVQFADDSETESSAFLEKYYDRFGESTGEPDLQQRSRNEEGNKRWLIKMDYVHPFSKDGKFEIGYQSTLRDITNDYKVEEFDDVNWKSLERFTNNFIYDENIHAAYAGFGNKHRQFSYQFGLRAEYSDVSTKLLNTGQYNPREYFDLFPSVFLTYDLPKENSVQISYSRRINRPRFWFLNPFFTFSDSRNQFAGNPDLDPEYTNSFEITHIKYWGEASLSSAVYYRHTTGLMQRVREILDEEEGTTITLPRNLATEDAFGAEFTFSYSPFKWWRLNGDWNFFRSIVDGSNESQSFAADNYSWFTRMTSRMTVLNETDIQVRLNYRAREQTVQGTREPLFHVDLGFSRDIFKKNGTLTLSVRDLFNSRIRRYTSFGDNFFAEGDWRWRVRSVDLTLNYRLNQKKSRQRGGRNGNWQGGGGF